jgi:hypothetical protein
MDRMERELTVKQRRFAAGVASGLSKTKAYDLAYRGNNMKRSTSETAAKQFAKKTRVKAEIERRTWSCCPGWKTCVRPMTTRSAQSSG